MEEDPLDTVKDICKDTRGGKIIMMQSFMGQFFQGYIDLN